jgi:hypothetical protein
MLHLSPRSSLQTAATATHRLSLVTCFSTTSYGDSWEKFWASISDDPQDVLWNASHDQAVAIDWQHMEEFIAPGGGGDTKNNGDKVVALAVQLPSTHSMRLAMAPP